MFTNQFEKNQNPGTIIHYQGINGRQT